MSISPTFYKQLFCTKDFKAAFLYLHCRFKLFQHKEIGTKAARKMLVKVTPCGCCDSCTSRRCSPRTPHPTPLPPAASSWARSPQTDPFNVIVVAVVSYIAVFVKP